MQNELVLNQGDLEQWFDTDDVEEFEQYAEKYCSMLEQQLPGYSVDYSPHVIQDELNGAPLHVAAEEIRSEIQDAMAVVAQNIF